MAMNWDMKIRSTKRIGEKAPIRDLVHLGDWRLLYGWSWAGLRLQSVGAWELPDGNGERELGTARQRIELLKQTFAWKIQGLHLFDNTCERNMRWFLCLMDLVTDMKSSEWQLIDVDWNGSRHEDCRPCVMQEVVFTRHIWVFHPEEPWQISFNWLLDSCLNHWLITVNLIKFIEVHQGVATYMF